MLVSAGITARSDRFKFIRKTGLPHWTAALLLTGESEKTVAGSTVRRRAPFFSLTRPHTPYRIAAVPGSGRYREYWAIFSPRPEWERLLRWPGERAGSVYLPMHEAGEVAAAMKGIFEAMFACRQGAHPERQALAENALERLLLVAQALRAPAARALDPRVRQAVDFINARLGRRLALGTIAARVALSPSRLAHLFTEAMGIAPLKYLEGRRLETAKNLLLSTNEPVKAVGAAIGFANPYHFSTRFRRRVGVSPRQFRRHGGQAG